MKNNMKIKRDHHIHPFLAFVALTLSVIMSCNPDKMSMPATILLDESSISLVLGTSQTLTATLTPSAPTSDIVWSSSMEEVATVKDGVVQAVGLGKATICAGIGGSLSFCDVTVTPQFVPVEGISIDRPDLEMRVGDVLQLHAVFDPENASNRRKRWSSSNANVASIHEINGTLTALSLGRTLIMVKSLDGSHEATLTVDVLPVIELYTPSESVLKLHPTDPDRLVDFSWNSIEGISKYVLKISTSNLFEDDKILYSTEVTEPRLAMSEYSLNEISKTIPDNPVSLFWTVVSGTPGMKLLPATGDLNLVPDRREYLSLVEESASGMQIRKDGAYHYAITTTGPAHVNSSILENSVPADSSVVCLQYRSDRALQTLTIRFMSSGGAVVGTVQKQVVQASDWRELRFVRKKLPDGWGNAGDYLQMDFGDAVGYEIELNAIHLTGMTSEEEKENYIPQMLSISYWSSHLTPIEHQSDYFKFTVTGRDSNASTVPLTEELPSGAVLLSFEYISDKLLANDLQVFLGPKLSEKKSIRTGTVPQAGTWTEYTVDLTGLRASYDWGHPGDFLRIDFGDEPSIGMTMEIRNIRIRFK